MGQRFGFLFGATSPTRQKCQVVFPTTQFQVHRKRHHPKTGGYQLTVENPKIHFHSLAIHLTLCFLTPSHNLHDRLQSFKP